MDSFVTMAGANCKASGQRAFFEEGIRKKRRNSCFSNSKFAGALRLSRANPTGILPGVSVLINANRSDPSTGVSPKIDN
jgi:hypothetical protein